MDRRIQVVGRGPLARLGVLLVFALALGGLLAACGGGGERDEGAVPSTPEEAGNIVIRVSGADGTAYSGDYGSLATETEMVDDTLGSQPQEYPVEVEEGTSDGIIAFFRKVEPGTGELKAEILADEEVVTESRTRAEFGSISVEWLPEIGAFEDGGLEGDVPPEPEE